MILEGYALLTVYIGAHLGLIYFPIIVYCFTLCKQHWSSFPIEYIDITHSA